MKYMLELLNDNINYYILQFLVLFYRSCMSDISHVLNPTIFSLDFNLWLSQQYTIV